MKVRSLLKFASRRCTRAEAFASLSSTLRREVMTPSFFVDGFGRRHIVFSSISLSLRRTYWLFWNLHMLYCIPFSAAKSLGVLLERSGLCVGVLTPIFYLACSDSLLVKSSDGTSWWRPPPYECGGMRSSSIFMMTSLWIFSFAFEVSPKFYEAPPSTTRALETKSLSLFSL